MAESSRETRHVRPVIPRPGYAVTPQQGPGGKTRYLLAGACKPYATHDDIVRNETVRRADDESFFLGRVRSSYNGDAINRLSPRGGGCKFGYRKPMGATGNNVRFVRALSATEKGLGGSRRERVRLSARAHAQRPIGAAPVCTYTRITRANDLYGESPVRPAHNGALRAFEHRVLRPNTPDTARRLLTGPVMPGTGSRSSEKFGPGPEVRRNDNYTAFTGPQRFLCTPATVRFPRK